MILWLTLAVLVAAVVLAVILDRPIPTPIPKSVLEFAGRVRSGPWLLTLWRTVLVVVLFSVAFALVAGGGILGGFVAAVIVTMFITDPVQAVVADLWNMNFVRVDP